MQSTGEAKVINPEINIGTIINLHDLVKSRMLIQANSGGGKSAIARVIMEQAYGKIPFAVMDIDGEYYTLKELYGDIIVIGGQHADVPISIELAKQLPRFIIENGLSVVLDVSDMEMNERIRFARIFLESLMSLPQQFWVPLLIFLEECHKLAGEQDKYESGPAVKDLMSRGRKRGYCGIPITQRISKLHKDVAAECNNKFIGRTYLDIDMERAAKELGFSKPADKIKLRDLRPGCFYAFGTSIEPHAVHEVVIKTPQTKMPQAGTNMNIVAKAPTDSLVKLLERLNEELSAKQNESNDSRELPVYEFDAGLERENESLRSEIMALKEQIEKLEHKERILGANFEKAMSVIELAYQIKNELNGAALPGSYQTDQVGPMFHQLPGEGMRSVLPDSSLDPYAVYQPKLSIKDSKPVKAETKPIKNGKAPANNNLPGGESTILTAIAMFRNGVKRDQLTTLTGYKRTSRDEYIRRLKQKEYVIQVDSERMKATPEGIKALGGNYTPLPTGKRLQQFWLDRLPRAEKAILEILIKAYPTPVHREKISELTSYKRTSRDEYLRRMAAKELLGNSTSGTVITSSNLF